jgi:hypothetical protein
MTDNKQEIKTEELKKIKLYIKFDQFNNKPFDTIMVPDKTSFKNIRKNLDPRIIDIYLSGNQNYTRKYVEENVIWQFRSSDNILIYEGDFEISQIHNGGTILIKLLVQPPTYDIIIELINSTNPTLFYQTTINKDTKLGDTNIYNDCIEYLKFHTNCKDNPSAHALYKLQDGKKFLLGSKYVLKNDEKYIWEWSLDDDCFKKNYTSTSSSSSSVDDKSSSSI